ncbi:DUF4349 domain-containing protein [Heyndrickxia sporothermodurans]|uniref:DUF4349 domain-containing protein n=1 Tax=Heyndrickxia sporothermodurans TaxID=46224 RepID=UPI002E1B4939|nr:DUF4349 domain-containing protein [Heyndrickxia sporothermodurans]
MTWLVKLFFVLCMTITVLIACSSGNSSSKSSENGKISRESKTDYANDDSSEENQVETNQDKKVDQNKQPQSRMVIYNASLDMEVKKIAHVQDQINKIVVEMGGYTIQQNMNQNSEERQESSLTVRIPQDHFQAFLDKVKKLGVRTENQHISGQDVTEEYVDLKARLKSKQVAEKRLIHFMNEAKDTKTLLEISNELAKVQEEIESIQGQMKYLENQTSLSTVTITLFENKVVVPGLEKDQLNTWEKTKKQFMNSINFIVSFISGLFVFIVGYLPVIVILGLIGVVITLIWRKAKKKSDNTVDK